MKVGFFVSKFLPPHKGHIWSIEHASKQCDILYVLVAENKETCQELCKQANIPYFDLATKTKWIEEAFRGYKNVKVLSMGEDGIRPMPEGWAEWSKAVQKLVGQHIDIIFGSEPSYASYYKKYFPTSKYVLQDINRVNVPISSTKIRSELKGNLPYIIDSAKPFFEKALKDK